MSGGYPWRTADWPIYVTGGIPVVGTLLLVAVELPARLLGGAWLPITSSDWLVRVAGILRHPFDPAAARPGPQGSAAPGPLAYGVTLVLLLAILSLPVVLVWRLRAQGGELGAGEPGAAPPSRSSALPPSGHRQNGEGRARAAGLVTAEAG